MAPARPVDRCACGSRDWYADLEDDRHREAVCTMCGARRPLPMDEATARHEAALLDAARRDLRRVEIPASPLPVATPARLPALRVGGGGRLTLRDVQVLEVLEAIGRPVTQGLLLKRAGRRADLSARRLVAMGYLEAWGHPVYGLCYKLAPRKGA